MKKKILLTIISIFTFCFIFTFIVSVIMIKTTSSQIVSINNINSINDVDAILILGCKVNGDSPSMMLQYRLDKGIEVYKLINKKILITGDHKKENYDEVNVMRNYLLNAGIDSKDIFQDHAGISTYDSIYRAKYIFDVKKVLIITQEYHMSRALYIANALDIDAYGVVANDVPYKGIMLKNKIREVLSRDKNFIKTILKPKSKYLGDKISLEEDGNITNG